MSGQAAPAPGAQAAPSAREALLSWRYLRLASAGFLAALTIVSLVANLIPILTSRGLSRDTAAGLAALVGAASIAGRLIGGYCLDRVNGNVVGAISLLLGAGASLLLLLGSGSTGTAALAVLLLGLSLGAELDAVAYLTSRHFALENFGVLFGTISGLLALATGLGPLLVSLSFDHSGHYEHVLAAYVPLCLAAAALFLSLGAYPDRKSTR
jgi:predicted MFS family arabinose efflux permease